MNAARLGTILDSMVEAVFVVDDSGRIVLTNRALDELLERDVRGSRPKKLIRSDQLRVAVRRARKERVATEAEIEGEIGGRILTFRVHVSPLPGRSDVVAVLHDVTSLKEADKVRRDFVANAAHELRTPLTAIRGFAETLHNGALSNPDVATSFVEGILRHAERLERLAEDLALLSRAESAEQAYQPANTDVVAVCHDAANSLKALALDHDVKIRLALPDGPVVAFQSARAIEEVLVNLLENAIKFSKRGGKVILTLRRRGEEVRLAVRDFGIGIPPELHTRIFERFYRVDQGRSRDAGGSGLGLAIVWHLVTRMRGRISVESAPGKGARFTVVVPASSRAAAPPSAS